jgi:hypothetical protein
MLFNLHIHELSRGPACACAMFLRRKGIYVFLKHVWRKNHETFELLSRLRSSGWHFPLGLSVLYSSTRKVHVFKRARANFGTLKRLGLDICAPDICTIRYSVRATIYIFTGDKSRDWIVAKSFSKSWFLRSSVTLMLSRWSPYIFF